MFRERGFLCLLLAGLSAALVLGCGQSTEDRPMVEGPDAATPDAALDSGIDATVDSGIDAGLDGGEPDTASDAGMPGCPERAPMLENMDSCAGGAFCEYDQSIPSDGICRTTVAFCPSAGEPWQQRLFQRCSTTLPSDEGSWSGVLILLFVETAGTCGSLGRYEYHVDEDRLDEFLCEVVSRNASGTQVTETLRCNHQSLDASLDASFAMMWTGKFWEGTADVSLFSEASQVDCTSTYAVRAEQP